MCRKITLPANKLQPIRNNKHLLGRENEKKNNIQTNYLRFQAYGFVVVFFSII